MTSTDEPLITLIKAIFRVNLIHYITAVSPVCIMGTMKPIITVNYGNTDSKLETPFNQFTNDYTFLVLVFLVSNHVHAW